MIGLEKLKSDIEAGKSVSFPLVFLYHDVPFVAEQYISKLSEITGREITYVESPVRQSFFFNDSVDDMIVCFCDELSVTPSGVDVVVSKKVAKDIEYIDIPKLNPLWVKDYLFSCLDGVDKKSLEKLFKESKQDIYRLDNEIKKLLPFSKKEKTIVFRKMESDGQFSDMTDKTVFDFTNAILRKDKETLVELLLNIESINFDPLALPTLLYTNFKRYIQVWMAKNPTEDSVGLSQKAIYAISRQPKVYNKEQLINCFKFVCSIDKMLKSGNIENYWLLDYIICKVFTM